MTRGTAGCGGRRQSHATIILLAAEDGDVLSTIREQKHLLHHRSHCRYRHRPQSAPRVLAQGLPRPATSNFIRDSWELGKSLNRCGRRRIASLPQFCFHELKRRCLLLASWISRTEGKSEVKRAALSELRLDPYSSRMFFDHHFCNVESKSYAATILVMYL
jgi:hypothetical protein